MADGVQYISELGFDLSPIEEQFNKLNEMVRQQGINMYEYSKANWKLGAVFENRAAGGDATAANILKNSDALKMYSAAFEDAGISAETFKKRQESLNDGLAKSQIKVDETSAALKQAKKDYKEYGEAILGKDYLVKFYQDSNKAKQEVNEFRSALNNTAKEAKAYDGKFRA